MASVHFTTMPCAPYTAQKVQGNRHFCDICPCAKDFRTLAVRVYERC